MRNLIFLLLIGLLGSGAYSLSIQTPDPLFKIMKNGKWGFIDQHGKIVIQPVFWSVDDFSEGLAPARMEGLYGFINMSGEFDIAPQFDFAESFHEGVAKVYINGKPHFIDKSGNIPFDHGFKGTYRFGSNGTLVAETQSGKFGLINALGEIILDTIYEEITPYSPEAALVTGANHAPYDMKEVYELGTVDDQGNEITPFGVIQEIIGPGDNTVKVSVVTSQEENASAQYGILSPNGRLSVKYSDEAESIMGHWEEVTSFRHKRAFAKAKHNYWYLIDYSGNPINDRPYKKILFDPDSYDNSNFFKDGVAFVEVAEGWGVIDTSGKWVAYPTSVGGSTKYESRIGSFLFFASRNDESELVYGFMNAEMDEVVEAQFQHLEGTDFSTGLTVATKGEQTGYINKHGIFIWTQQEDLPSNIPLNIDFMNRGYFYASSTPMKKYAGFGGWGRSKNGFYPIPKETEHLPDSLSIKVVEESSARFAEAFLGNKLYIANVTQDTFVFAAQDSRLYLVIQAKDPNGDWKDIEYLPSSWCGNSYHQVFLPPKHQWEFTIPVYEGAFQTVLRAQLFGVSKKLDEEGTYVLSNEFPGSVNPAQFWRKRTYYSSGIMDPYND